MRRPRVTTCAQLCQLGIAPASADVASSWPVASQLSPPTLVDMQSTQAALGLVAPSGLPCALADLDPTSAAPANQEACECGDRMSATLSVSGLHR